MHLSHSVPHYLDQVPEFRVKLRLFLHSHVAISVAALIQRPSVCFVLPARVLCGRVSERGGGGGGWILTFIAFRCSEKVDLAA